MNPVLLVAPDCPSCSEAQSVWQRACAERGLVLELRHHAEGEDANTVPLLILEGVPVFAGVPDAGQAGQILSGCMPDSRAGAS